MKMPSGLRKAIFATCVCASISAAVLVAAIGYYCYVEIYLPKLVKITVQWSAHDLFDEYGIDAGKKPSNSNMHVCSSEHPLAVTIHNKSPQTVSYTRFRIAVMKEGYSSNLAIRSDSVTSDKILKPGESEITCWSMPELRAHPTGGSAPYIYTPEEKYVRFQ